MMLTSLHCQKEGLTYASVHDCFWTHPNRVELMNRLCREQFVALHSQPILDDLAQYFIETYVSLPSRLSDNKIDLNHAAKLLGKRSNKGSFDLTQVLKSIYFFS